MGTRKISKIIDPPARPSIRRMRPNCGSTTSPSHGCGSARFQIEALLVEPGAAADLPVTLLAAFLSLFVADMSLFFCCCPAVRPLISPLFFGPKFKEFQK